AKQRRSRRIPCSFSAPAAKRGVLSTTAAVVAAEKVGDAGSDVEERRFSAAKAIATNASPSFFHN
ncbi:MAG: hypothetical protein WB683_07770, partial [Candidatus Sulfotelmatobacter sp.]